MKSLTLAKLTTGVLLSVGLVMPPRSSATVLAFDFEGTITGVNDTGGALHSVFGDLSLLVGQLMTGAFSYDTLAIDRNPHPYQGDYIFDLGDSRIFVEFVFSGKKAEPLPSAVYNAYVAVAPMGLFPYEYHFDAVGDVVADGSGPVAGALKLGLGYPPGSTYDGLPNVNMILHALWHHGELVAGDSIGFTLTKVTERTALVPEGGATGWLSGVSALAVGLFAFRNRLFRAASK